jgi:AcrR family transcriptional regulator
MRPGSVGCSVVAQSKLRERNPVATRARIAAVALELFQSQSYAETTIDQIAAGAHVGRRTVFEHFPSKEAIVFDHLVVRREVALDRLRARPDTEPPLLSLHAVLREMCDQGYDRGLLAQIRAVIAANATLAAEQLSIGNQTFEDTVVAILQKRPRGKRTSLELHALAQMAFGWFLTAIRIYFKGQQRSLVRCYDDVVSACVQAVAADFCGSDLV